MRTRSLCTSAQEKNCWVVLFSDVMNFTSSPTCGTNSGSCSLAGSLTIEGSTISSEEELGSTTRDSSPFNFLIFYSRCLIRSAGNS